MFEEFIKEYVSEILGAPHNYCIRHDLGIIISVPRKETRPGPRYGKEINLKFEGWRESWVETSDNLIDELRRADFGNYSLRYVNPAYIELEKE